MWTPTESEFIPVSAEQAASPLHPWLRCALTSQAGLLPSPPAPLWHQVGGSKSFPEEQSETLGTGLEGAAGGGVIY